MGHDNAPGKPVDKDLAHQTNESDEKSMLLSEPGTIQARGICHGLGKQRRTEITKPDLRQVILCTLKN